MKFTLIAAFAFIATAMAQTNTTVVPNGMGGTAASASISVGNGTNPKSAGNQFNAGVATIALTSVATAAYALL